MNPDDFDVARPRLVEVPEELHERLLGLFDHRSITRIEYLLRVDDRRSAPLAVRGDGATQTPATFVFRGTSVDLIVDVTDEAPLVSGSVAGASRRRSQTLSGVVLGESVEGATVSVDDEASATTRSTPIDALGRFALGGLSANRHQLRIVRGSDTLVAVIVLDQSPTDDVG